MRRWRAGSIWHNWLGIPQEQSGLQPWPRALLGTPRMAFMRDDRLLSAILLLQAHGQLSRNDLAERLGVSLRTVQRDMEALSAAGVPVVALRGSAGWQLDEIWRAQPGLGEAELRARLNRRRPQVAGRKNLGVAEQPPIVNLKTARILAPGEKATAIRQRLYVDSTSWRGTSENLSMLPIVQEAVSRDRKLEIDYWRGGHERVERTVDPLGLVAKGRAWYLVALTPGGFRTYRVSRIESATVLDTPSERPPDFDLAAYWTSSTRQFREGLPRYYATLRLEERAANWMKLWYAASPAHEGESGGVGGWTTLRVEFEHEEQACFVVLGLGARVEVVEPASLRERVAIDTAAGMSTIVEGMDDNSFAPVGFDELFRELEAQRRSVARKLEAERRAAQELEIAKQVQARLFPQTLPPMKTLDYAGVCIQAREVGGDYYDFLDLGTDRLGLVIGDISGKGIAAALLMANLQANLRSQCAIALDQPQRLLKSVNRLFYENTTDNAYATLFFAVYEDEARRLRYANCGHLSALLLQRDGTLLRLDSTCTVLGLFKEWESPIHELCLTSGDILALYTDGITESFNEKGEEFGEVRLIEVLRRHSELPSRVLLASIVDDVRQFSPREQHDDITLIVAKCKA